MAKYSLFHALYFIDSINICQILLWGRWCRGFHRHLCDFFLFTRMRWLLFLFVSVTQVTTTNGAVPRAVCELSAREGWGTSGTGTGSDAKGQDTEASKWLPGPLQHGKGEEGVALSVLTAQEVTKPASVPSTIDFWGLAWARDTSIAWELIFPFLMVFYVVRFLLDAGDGAHALDYTICTSYAAS